MAYNKDVDVDITGDIAGTSLEEIGQRIVENMRMMEILAALSNGYHDKFGSAENAPDGVDKAWTDIHDLMAHFDEASVNLKEEPVETNQLTLIRQLWVMNMIDYKEGAALRDKFNARVKDALGVELDENALQGLFDLFNEFDIGDELAEIRGVEKKDIRPLKR